MTKAVSLIALALSMVILPATGARATERYVVPVWTQSLDGANGTWYGQVTVSNPGAAPVVVRVTRVFPMVTTDCSSCVGEPVELEIEPYGSRSLYPPLPVPEQRLVAGAFEVEASGPLKFDNVVFRPGPMPIVQRIDVARRWLDPGRHTIHGVPRGSTINVFVVNPAERALEIALWTGQRIYNEVRVVVPAGTTSVVALPPTRCGDAPCLPNPPMYPPPPLTVEVDALGPSMVSVSSVTGTWAVFTLADEAGW